MKGGVRGLWLTTMLMWCILCVMPACVLGLSAGSVYELVSPVYKSGYGVNGIVAVAPDGGNVAFISVGAFAGDPSNDALTNDYIAHREASGWSTAPVTTPATLAPHSHLLDFSGTVETSLSEGNLGSNYSTAYYESSELEYFLHSANLPDTAANFEVAGLALKNPVLRYAGASPDFSHILFESTQPLLPEAKTSTSTKHEGLYDLTTQVLGGTPILRYVGLNNRKGEVNTKCNVALAVEGSGKSSQYNSVAADGQVVFFRTGVNAACTGQLFVRLGGTKTLEVSRPLGGCVANGISGEVPCEDSATRAPAEFQGANEAGTRVFFTTRASLVGGGSGGVNDLYMATIECPEGGTEGCGIAEREVKSLVQVSSGTEPAEVNDVVVLAPDGSRVYFVARGALSANPNREGEKPIKGADNLYAYSSVTGGAPAFIGDLCSGPEESGLVNDVRCPGDLSSDEGSEENDTRLWASNVPEAQTSADGRFLVFSSYARLAHDDVNQAKDVYRYDSDTGRLIRVSVGEEGFGANGNSGECANRRCNATIARNLEFGLVYWQLDLNGRAVSGDGSRVVFTSSEPLSASAINGFANVYEWQEAPGSGEGAVSLVSTGSSDQPTEEIVISQAGTDVFFNTSQGLVPQDTDGQSDIYDARLDGGFPEKPAAVQPCSGDACQGPLTNPAPLLVPGSVSQASGGNFSAPVVKQASTTAKKAKKSVKAKKSKRAKKVKKGKASVRSRDLVIKSHSKVGR